MMCRNPYSGSQGYYPCGQCNPCRMNRRRVWKHRLVLEASQYSDNAFVTLTYDDEHLPEGGSLVPKDPQDWLKRIRKSVAPLRLRYYLVGEYGDQTGRPHYHAALFNFPTCMYGTTRSHRISGGCCPRCDMVLNTWGKGGILLGQLTPESAQYIAGYVLKKMTGKNDERLQGRHPEFARMSLRPGIGFGVMDHVAASLRSFNLDRSQADVPSALRHGNKLLPLGRYLRRKLRVAMGRSENAPQETLDELRAEVLAVQKAAIEAPEFVSAKELLLRKDAQKVASMEARGRIFRKENKL